MVIPIVAYLLIFKYWPMWFLRISFYDYKLLFGFEGSSFVGLRWYERMFRNPEIFQYIRNTLSLNTLALIFVFPAPVGFALLLNELRRMRYKRIVQTFSYLPHFISTVVLVAMIRTFLSPSLGTLASISKLMGEEPVAYLLHPQYFRTICVLSGIWQGIGWNAIVYLSALTGIDEELYEAATIDGARRVRRIWHVTLPGIRNTIVLLLILQIGNMMHVNFEKVYLLQNNLNLSVSEMLPTFIYKTGMVQQKYSYATAAGLFNSVVSLILVVGANYVSRKYSETSLF
jgi:putative aldouronate transport system permease protein